MKAIQIVEDSLVWEEIKLPEPKKDEVLIKISATAINRADLAQRAGNYPPPEGETDILGLECSGKIVKVGENVSDERIGEEVKKMLLDEQRGVAAWELQYLGLDRFIFDEPSCMNAPTRLGRLFNVSSYATTLAAWLIDRHGNQADVQTIATKWRDQLLLSNKVFDELKETLSIHKQLFGWDQLGTAAQKRIAASPVCDAAMTILHAEDAALFVEIRRSIIEHEKTGIAPERFINGHDLLDAGLRPSPKLGDVLEAVYDAQLEGSISGRDDALRLAKAIYSEITDTQ